MDLHSHAATHTHTPLTCHIYERMAAKFDVQIIHCSYENIKIQHWIQRIADKKHSK